MAGNQIEEVKAKTDIVSVIGEYVDLKKAGRNFKGNCPFHSEKTPSFVVSPELQMFKCFGCGVSGDVFTFLQEYEGLEFAEALEQLADRAGVKLEKPDYSKTSKRNTYLSINETVGKLYQYLLLKHPVGRQALGYLTTKRKLSMDTIRTFGLGFSPRNSQIVESYLVKKKKISVTDLETLGLIYRREGRIIDRFNGRVIFPLYDHRGAILGFSGRILPEFDTGRVGKYINSPETPLYHKSSLLYGLNVTRTDIKRLRNAIVVEGELDLLSVWQSGIKNIVAIKGSALTKEQVSLISRYADTITLALDADTAGDAASRRGIQIAEEADLEVKVVRLGEYKDPDEAVKANTREFIKRIDEAIPAWDFFIESALSRYDVSTGSGMSKASDELVPILASIEDAIVQAHYIGIVSQKLGISAEAVADEVSKSKYTKQSRSETPEGVAEQKSGETDARKLRERRLLSIAFNDDLESLLTDEVKALFTHPLHKKIISEFEAYQSKHSVYELGAFANFLPDELRDGFNSLVLHDERVLTENKFSKKEFDEIVSGLKLMDIEAEVNLNNKKIRSSKDSRLISKLEKRNSELLAEKSKLLADR